MVITHVNCTVTKVYTINPFMYIAPRIFDMPVLNGSYTIRTRSSSSVVSHAISATG